MKEHPGGCAEPLPGTEGQNYPFLFWEHAGSWAGESRASLSLPTAPSAVGNALHPVLGAGNSPLWAQGLAC